MAHPELQGIFFFLSHNSTELRTESPAKQDYRRAGSPQSGAVVGQLVTCRGSRKKRKVV